MLDMQLFHEPQFPLRHIACSRIPAEEAQKRIGMVVEGAYTCVSALQLSKQYQVDLPIAEAVNQIIYHSMRPIDAVSALMQRTIKEEHL